MTDCLLRLARQLSVSMGTFLISDFDRTGKPLPVGMPSFSNGSVLQPWHDVMVKFMSNGNHFKGCMCAPTCSPCSVEDTLLSNGNHFSGVCVPLHAHRVQ